MFTPALGELVAEHCSNGLVGGVIIALDQDRLGISERWRRDFYQLIVEVSLQLMILEGSPVQS
ncbi:MAG: hypothetical protein VXA38_04175, partial [Aquiluna sp.]